MSTELTTNSVLGLLGQIIDDREYLNEKSTDMNTDYKELKEKCIKYISEYTQAVLESPKFLTISREVLSYIMCEHKFDMKEDDIVGCIIRWAKEECLRHRKQDPNQNQCIKTVLGKTIVSHICWYNMSTEEKLQNAALKFDGLLKKKQIDEAIQLFHLKDVDPCLPERPLLFMRFRENGKTGKGYNGEPDGITFTVSTRLAFNSFLIFGTSQHNGGYKLQVKLVDEQNNPVFENKNIEIETDKSKKYHKVPVYSVEVQKILEANTRYRLVVTFKGPASYMGAGGREEVVCQGIKIKFFTDSSARNGTTTLRGQFPGFIFTKLN